MDIVCLDMEGVLVPEIWIAFAEESGIPELRRTTRDEPDYDKLMTWRLGILNLLCRARPLGALLICSISAAARRGRRALQITPPAPVFCTGW